MIIRADNKKRRGGVVKYWLKGNKSGRGHSRDELDYREVYLGDYDAFEKSIEILESRQKEEGTDYSNYHHFTISFSKDDLEKLTKEDKANIIKKFIKFHYSGFNEEELIVIAEAHIPKMKFENGKERFEHIHIAVSKLNAVTGMKVSPRVHNMYSDKLHQAYLCKKFGLDIPLIDAPRLNPSMEKAKILSRYKNDEFIPKKTQKSEILKTLKEELKDIKSKEEFLDFFADENIELKQTKKGIYYFELDDGERLNIRGKNFPSVEKNVYGENPEYVDIYSMPFDEMEKRVNELIEARVEYFTKALKTQRERASEKDELVSEKPPEQVNKSLLSKELEEKLTIDYSISPEDFRKKLFEKTSNSIELDFLEEENALMPKTTKKTLKDHKEAIAIEKKSSAAQQKEDNSNERAKSSSLKLLVEKLKQETEPQKVLDYCVKKFDIKKDDYRIVDDNKIETLYRKRNRKLNTMDFFTKEINLPFKEALFELRKLHNPNQISYFDLINRYVQKKSNLIDIQNRETLGRLDIKKDFDCNSSSSIYSLQG